MLPPSLEEAVGCQQCQQGTKLVLFVTGRCHWGCAYCPLSENRRESPVMYANERPCTTWSEVLEEARAMDATGTGITGGDPMLDLERSLDAIRELKGAFGHAHHIHLYTSIPIEPDVAQRLADAGLDELRFHLLDLNLDRYRASLAGAVDAGLVTGIELPAQPDQVHALEALIEDLRDEPIAFLNLNELEITVGNQEQMDVRGFNLGSGPGAAAAGSADLAIRLRDRVLVAALGQPDPFDDVPRAPYGYHLKFCTASFKDAGQLRARFRRRAEVTLRPYETVSEDDTIHPGRFPWIHPMSRRTSRSSSKSSGSTQNGCGMMTWRTGSSFRSTSRSRSHRCSRYPLSPWRCTRPMSAWRSAWSGSMNIGQDARRHLQTDDHGP